MDRQNAKNILADMAELESVFSTAPTLKEMPHRRLEDKLIEGPTSAHVIEEIHTPLNLAYVTFTTGSTAFQNIVGVSYEEMPERVEAGKAALERGGAQKGDSLLVCYPPLVNVFSRQVFDDLAIRPQFLSRSSRDAFLLALCEAKPQMVIGESSFLRAALEDAKKLGIWSRIPKGTIFFAAGTPLDLELVEVVSSLEGSLYDLYGCQEFGWLVMDGLPLRSDIVLAPDPQMSGWSTLVVGGLPTNDSFPLGEEGHVLNARGKIITSSRRRSSGDLEVVIHATTAKSAMTVDRVARSILRIKGRIVRLAPGLTTGASENVLEIKGGWPEDHTVIMLEKPEATVLFRRLLEAQEHYQSQAKNDPLWMKRS